MSVVVVKLKGKSGKIVIKKYSVESQTKKDIENEKIKKLIGTF